MKARPNKQPCAVCRGHKGGKPMKIRDDDGKISPNSNYL